jgi:hypothetical protein
MKWLLHWDYRKPRHASGVEKLYRVLDALSGEHVTYVGEDVERYSVVRFQHTSVLPTGSLTRTPQVWRMDSYPGVYHNTRDLHAAYRVVVFTVGTDG